MPEVTRRGALDMQVCVPKDWTDEQVKAFADRENLCGTENGWFIRKEGDPALRLRSRGGNEYDKVFDRLVWRGAGRRSWVSG